MAKIKVRPHPGALSELLNKKGMTQMDARDKTGVDRKTLLRIERGEEVKLETLQRVATKLQVPEGYFSGPPAAEGMGSATDNSSPLEPGTVMLRKLDVTDLERLLRGAQILRWQLNAPVRDEAARKFLEELDEAVENFRKQVQHEEFADTTDAPVSLRFQLDRLKNRDDIAARLERLAEHRVVLLGTDYLFWECAHVEHSLPYETVYAKEYHSSNTVLLSVEPFGVQSRRVHVHIGSVPPILAPDIKCPIFVNSQQIPAEQEL